MFSWTARHLGIKRWRDVTVKISVTVILYLLLLALHTPTLTVRYEPSSMNTPCDQVSVSLCGPCFLMMDYWCTNNLPLQPFSPQLSGNIRKKGSLQAFMPSSDYPPAVICCHTVKLHPQVIYSFSRLTPASPLLSSCRQDGPERYRWLEERACAE